MAPAAATAPMAPAPATARPRRRPRLPQQSS